MANHVRDITNVNHGITNVTRPVSLQMLSESLILFLDGND